MPNTPDQLPLEVLLDSWDRNNSILLNLLRILPKGALEDKATESSPAIAQQYMHIHHERLVSVFEEAPEYARNVPEEEWSVEANPDRIAQMLTESARAVREAVKGRILAGRNMDLNYDHPILMLQFMLWHEGYHFGQIKLALKIRGHSIPDEQTGPVTWDIWRQRGERLQTLNQSKS
jgi:hypothetical protein